MWLSFMVLCDFGFSCKLKRKWKRKMKKVIFVDTFFTRSSMPKTHICQRRSKKTVYDNHYMQLYAVHWKIKWLVYCTSNCPASRVYSSSPPHLEGINSQNIFCPVSKRDKNKNLKQGFRFDVLHWFRAQFPQLTLLSAVAIRLDWL